MISHLSFMHPSSSCEVTSCSSLDVPQAPLQAVVSSLGRQVLVQQYDESSLIRVIQDEFPKLAIQSIKVLSNSWNNVVADINDEWIFRFPRSESFIPVLERERVLLDNLRQCLSLPIPYYQFVGVRTVFVGYRKICGEPLSRELYLTFSHEERQAIADTLALFLDQLHKNVNVNETITLGYEPRRISLYWIEESIRGTLSSSDVEHMILEAIAYLKEYVDEKHEDVFLHNDLHGENLALNLKEKRITGIFDFSDAVIGNYAVDFRRFFDIHEDLAFRISASYSKMRGVPNPLFPAAAYHILHQALYIMLSREAANQAQEVKIIQHLQPFVALIQV